MSLRSHIRPPDGFNLRFQFIHSRIWWFYSPDTGVSSLFFYGQCLSCTFALHKNLNRMERVNIYGFPHKGLRNALGQLGLLVGRLNTAQPEDVNEVKVLAHDISELLKLHLKSEESHVLPPLEARVPGSTQDNKEDHQKMEELEHFMANSIDGIKDAATAEAAYQAVNMFVREYFRHMDEEEVQMNQIIWQHFNNEEILEWQGRILSELSPDQFAKWFRFIIPALSPIEQSIMLGGFKANAPSEVYEGMMQGLNPFLTESQKAHIATI